MKRIHAIPLKHWYDMIFVAVLLLLEGSLVVFGVISAA